MEYTISHAVFASFLPVNIYWVDWYPLDLRKSHKKGNKSDKNDFLQMLSEFFCKNFRG